jgi:transcriptional regulator with XRE-family HTH domain
MPQLEPSGTSTVVISSEDRAFFKALGARIAQLRREQGITQVQLAEILSVSQQTVNAYETAERRVPVSALPMLAKTLAVSLEELIGTPEPVKRAGKRGPTPKLQQQVERLSRLPQAKQRMVMQMLEGFLNQTAKNG